MAYINVDEVYILDNTGAQVDAVTDIPFKADAGLTDAQKAQARANLGISAGGGGGGRNLMDNPWFTINQRDVAVGVIVNSSNYIADRWVATGSAGAQRNADGTITNNATIYQKLSATIPVGKDVTFSALLADGTVEAWTDTFDGSSTKTMTLPSFGTSRFYMGSTPPQINLGACAKAIVAVKLELGSTSTLANDAPPDYGEELRKCMWYFRRIKSSMSYEPVGYGFQTSSVYCNMKIAGEMRAAPTPTFSGTLRLVGNNSASVDVTSLESGQTDTEGVVVKAKTAGNLSANHAYVMYLTSGSYIDLSADL